MDISLTQVSNSAKQLEIDTCLKLNPKILIPEQRIRNFCRENKCSNYDAHHMCPPRIGSLEEVTSKLGEFHQGILLRYSKPVDAAEDYKGVVRTKVAFHNKILELEEHFAKQGINNIWGMIGGSCALCEFCKARSEDPCPYPDKARTSLESIGIDVQNLLEKYGLDNKFYSSQITWTGCILF